MIPAFIHGIGTSLTFIIYAILGIAAFLFILRYVPETRRKSLEQIEHYWRNGGHWEGQAYQPSPFKTSS
jgi:uncharacterized membrane protein YuzA (DUF378 family)